jgi:hypothetical protein
VSRRSWSLLSLAASLALGVPTGAASIDDPPSARTVIARVRAYVDGYLTRLSALVAEETADQRVLPLDAHNRWRADFAVVRSDDGAWLGLRDVFEHAGRPLAARGELTSRLFSGEREGIGVSARRIADASARINSGGRVRNFSTPMFGLALAASERHDYVRIRAQRTALGWKVRVQERERPTLVREEDGRPVFSTAEYNVDPATGAILAYDASVGRRSPIRLACRFARHEALDLLLPQRLEETFLEGTHAFIGVHTYTNWRKFEVASRIVP